MKLSTTALKAGALLLLGLALWGAVFAFLPSSTSAASGPDESLQSGGIVRCTGPGGACTLCDLYAGTRRLINFLLFYIALPLTVAAVAGSGIMFLLSGGSETLRIRAKSALSYAVIGLLLAFSAWVIVNTILTTLGFRGDWTSFAICKEFENLAKAPPGGRPEPPPTAPPPPSKTPPPGTFQTEAEARAFFFGAGIPIKPPCARGQTTECVNLVGLPKAAAEKILELSRACGKTAVSCEFRISGGTEAGHKTHDIGNGILDLVPKNLTPAALLELERQARKLGAALAHCEAQGGAAASGCAVPPANHVHIAFPP